MRLWLFAAALAALPAAAVDGTTAERQAVAKAQPRCWSARHVPKVSCPPYEIVYDKPKCQGGKLVWMKITPYKAEKRSDEFEAICAKPPPPIVLPPPVTCFATILGPCTTRQGKCPPITKPVNCPK